MTPDRYSLKTDARARLRSAVPRPMTEGLLYVLVVGALLTLAGLILTANITPEKSEKYMSFILNRQFMKAQDYMENLMPSTGEYLISSVLHLLSGIVAAGFSLFAMNTLRQTDASLGNLLDGFGRFFPLLLLLFLMRFLISAWFYLLVIPGFIAIYRYRMAVYLLLDHRELNPIQCLFLSAQIMRGKKWDFFLLDLSFLGWALLACLPLMLGLVLGSLPTLILGALGSAAVLIWLLPYYELCCVGFYDEIKLPVLSIPPDEPRE